MKKNTKSIVAGRRERALERQAEYDKLTLQEKLDRAMAYQSNGGAYIQSNIPDSKEVRKLRARIQQEQDKVLIPIKEDGTVKTRLTAEEKAARKKATKQAKQS